MLSPHRLTWLEEVTAPGHNVVVEPMEWLALEFLCFNMRDVDRREIYGNLPTANPLEWAAMIHQGVARNGCAWIARCNGRPAAVMGVCENFPGNWQVFSFGTEKYRRVLVYFKPKLDLMIAFGRERGMHRLECKSLASHKDAHRCTRFLGLGDPVLLRKYGRDGDDFLLFSRVWD